MLWYGVGSHTSPIVISDDEEEAYVEFALEQRISSPDEDMEYGSFGYGAPYEDLYPTPLENRITSSSDHVSGGPPDGAQVNPGTLSTILCFFDDKERSRSNSVYLVEPDSQVGQKRKRASSVFSSHEETRQLLPASTSADGRAASPLIPGESKNARKRRRKRERLANEQRNPGPSKASMSSTHLPPPITSLPSRELPFQPTRKPPPDLSLPPRPVTMSLASPQDNLSNVVSGKQPVHSDMLATSMSPTLYTMSPIPGWLPPVKAPPPPPVPPPLLPPPSAISPLSTSSSIPMQVPPPRKIIGLPPDEDPNSNRGTFSIPPGRTPPNPARTLVMELLPRKFRTTVFVETWADSFCSRAKSRMKPRVEVDIRLGKALVEFPTADNARRAWDSDRLRNEGKEHIRVRWYRVQGMGAAAGVGELEEGEIEEGELVKPVPTEPRAKQQRKAKKASHLSPAAPPFVPNLSRVAPTIKSEPGPSFFQRHTYNPEGASVDALPNSTSLYHSPHTYADRPVRATLPQASPLFPYDQSIPRQTPLEPPSYSMALPSPASNTTMTSMRVEAAIERPFNISAHGLSSGDGDSVASSRAATPNFSSIDGSASKTPIAQAARSFPNPPSPRPPSSSSSLQLSFSSTHFSHKSHLHLETAESSRKSPSPPSTAFSSTSSATTAMTDVLTDTTQSSRSSLSVSTPPPPERPIKPLPQAQSRNQIKQELLARQLQLERELAQRKAAILDKGASVSRSGNVTPTTTVAAMSLDNSVSSTPTNAAKIVTTTSTIQTTTVDLDDLAVSFITETIQTVKAPLNATTDSNPPTSIPLDIDTTWMSEKDILAAKQNLLQKNSAEVKALMDQWGSTSDKVEKAKIWRDIKERMRCVSCLLPTGLRGRLNDSLGQRTRNPRLLMRRLLLRRRACRRKVVGRSRLRRW